MTKQERIHELRREANNIYDRMPILQDLLSREQYVKNYVNAKTTEAQEDKAYELLENKRKRRWFQI